MKSQNHVWTLQHQNNKFHPLKQYFYSSSAPTVPYWYVNWWFWSIFWKDSLPWKTHIVSARTPKNPKSVLWMTNCGKSRPPAFIQSRIHLWRCTKTHHQKRGCVSTSTTQTRVDLVELLFPPFYSILKACYNNSGTTRHRKRKVKVDCGILGMCLEVYWVFKIKIVFLGQTTPEL